MPTEDGLPTRERGAMDEATNSRRLELEAKLDLKAHKVMGEIVRILGQICPDQSTFDALTAAVMVHAWEVMDDDMTIFLLAQRGNVDAVELFRLLYPNAPLPVADVDPGSMLLH